MATSKSKDSASEVTAAKKATTKKATAKTTDNKTTAKKSSAKVSAAKSPASESTEGGLVEDAANLHIEVRGADGGAGGSIDLPPEIFDVQVNIPLIHQVVVAQLAAARQGTHSTKTRGDVRGGGRKPYKQKGTGRARQGSTRSPQFVGGGVAHGPHPRDYSQRTPKKMKAAALRGALSDRARGGAIHVVSELVAGETPSTKSALAAISAISNRPHVLVVLDREETVSWLSLRNVSQVHVLAADQLNTYDVLVSDDVVFSHAGLTAFLERGGKRATTSIAGTTTDLEESA